MIIIHNSWVGLCLCLTLVMISWSIIFPAIYPSNDVVIGIALTVSGIGSLGIGELIIAKSQNCKYKKQKVKFRD